MDTDRHPGSDSSNFNPPSWLEMNNNNNNNSMHQSSQNSPPLPDYHSTMGYGMPLDSTYGMSIPPPYTSLPLAVPSNQWPSIIATQSRFSDSGLPHISLPGLSQVAPLPGRKASTGGATPRRTLTDEDRRRMCVYHEEHKTAKQTDIGALFGVERSTVSKVLRQKEKYLNANDGSRSPIKRSKGRVPDIEKALSNWARNYQKQGYQLSDAVIQEKAHFFASTCGNQNGKEKVLSARWLEKFKNKYLIGTKSRKGSFDTNKSDSVSPTGLSINSALASGVQSPTVMSPISPTGFASPTSLSPTQTQDNIKNNLAEGLANLAGDYQQHKSTTSPDTLSASVASPTSTLVSDGPFSPTSQSHFSPTDTSNRPRSQTFPVNTIDPTMISTEDQHQQQQHHHHHHHHQQTTEQSQPPSSKAAIQDSLSLSILESPFEVNHNINNATADASNTVKRNRSIPEIRPKSIYPPIYSKSATVSPISPPGSPTQDEARRALELVMNYFQHQPTGLCAQEYVTIGKLMERLDLAKNKSNMLPGGLTRIDEHDDVPPHLNRKRSIHGYV